ncbi:MAG: hypothetical protein ABEJ65_04955 [bacterium]
MFGNNRLKFSLIGALCFLLLVATAIPSGVLAEVSIDDVYREDPTQKYSGPVSFFFVHGYITGFYQDFEQDFHTRERNAPNPGFTGNGPLVGRPGNITLSQSGGDGSFSHDVGLVIGAEINSQLKLITEQHWINRNNPNSDDSGSPFKKLATTQANIEWKPMSDRNLKIRFGRFWSSFANAQVELLSGQNNFTTVPNARYALPYAFNDGIQIDGAIKTGGGKQGFNYTLEYVNGNSEFDKPSGGTFDGNHGKDILARVGFKPLSYISSSGAQDVEIGLSYGDGALREGLRSFTAGDTNPLNVNADWNGYGLDLDYVTDRYTFRGYWIQSSEELQGGPDMDRSGIMAEGKYTLLKELSVVGDMEAKLRYDQFERDAVANTATPNSLDNAQTYEDERISYGVEFHPQDQLRFGVEYHTSEEGGAYNQEADDDGFSAGITASF